MKPTKKNPRGAGRKPAGNVRLVAYVKPATLAAIDAVKGKTRGEVVDAKFA